MQPPAMKTVQYGPLVMSSHKQASLKLPFLLTDILRSLYTVPSLDRDVSQLLLNLYCVSETMPRCGRAYHGG